MKCQISWEVGKISDSLNSNLFMVRINSVNLQPPANCPHWELGKVKKKNAGKVRILKMHKKLSAQSFLFSLVCG